MSTNETKMALLVLVLTGLYGWPVSPLTADPPPTAIHFRCGNETSSSQSHMIRIDQPFPNEANFTGVHGRGQTLLDSLQCSFDVFSWQSFIALNHAMDGSFISGQPTIWESWPLSSDIFRDGGTNPGPWPANRSPAPEICPSGTNLPVISQLGKRGDVLEDTNEPFLSGPLIDANGFYTRFTISVNRMMYDYIRDNTLYSRRGQAAFARADGGNNKVKFPCGCQAFSPASGQPRDCSDQGQVGAVMVKASWKVIDRTQGDDPTSFHTTDALVFTPAHGEQQASCARRTMGLVGLHIGHKTGSAPQWLWSTFEHVNNVPTQGGPIPQRPFNYYKANCEGCNAVNKPPSQPWDPHGEPVSENSRKSQIMRVLPIEEATRTLNSRVRQLLRQNQKTVWANYELVSTQWPTKPTPSSFQPTIAQPILTPPSWCPPLNTVHNGGKPAPTFLANTTLETYIQGQVKNQSSSCIGCHAHATMAAGVVNNSSDFTYLLELAQ